MLVFKRRHASGKYPPRSSMVWWVHGWTRTEESQVQIPSKSLKLRDYLESVIRTHLLEMESPCSQLL